MIVNCKEIEESLMNEAKELLKNAEKHPKLAIVTCGEEDASKVYIKNKVKKCNSIGIKTEVFYTTDYLHCKHIITQLNKDDNVTDIILQLPTKLTKTEEKKLLNLICYEKDIDGLSEKSKMRHSLGLNLPCTSMAVLRIIKEQIGNDLSGKSVALYGRSDLVNKPLINVLIDMNATVSVFHSKSPIDNLLKDFDISVVAIGKAKHFKIKETSKKQLIIDVGINRDENKKLCGDVDTKEYKESLNIKYTPVPGGVGILTTSMLCLKIALKFLN